MRSRSTIFRRALTCVREQRMVVGMIVEFRPHAEGELLHVRQVHLVMDVLQDGKMYVHCVYH